MDIRKVITDIGDTASVLVIVTNLALLFFDLGAKYGRSEDSAE